MTLLNVLTSANELEAAILFSGYLPLHQKTQRVRFGLLLLAKVV
jgi:predicted esterase